MVLPLLSPRSNAENARAGFGGGASSVRMPESVAALPNAAAVEAAAHFLAGFLSCYPLQPAERSMVWRLAACRLATSGARCTID